MSKGNSGLLTKFQAKLPHSSEGNIGNSNGYEVFKEVVLRFRTNDASSIHSITVEGRVAVDDKWEDLGEFTGEDTHLLHIASYDYIRFYCNIYSSKSGSTELRASAYFQDGMFLANAVKEMSDKINVRLDQINSNICDLKEDTRELREQINIITEYKD